MKKLFFLFFIISTSAFAKTYNLEIKKQNILVAGKKVEAITINDGIPGSTLHWQEGEDVVVNVKNSMNEDTSLHWHGILLNGSMDGVPGLNGFEGIKSGQIFTYKFKIRQKGTYWYHSHSNLQEQRGVYGAIVIDSSCSKKSDRCVNLAAENDDKSDLEYVVLLSDFTEENPQVILNNLKIDSGYYNYRKRTIGTFFSDIGKNGFFDTVLDYMSWGEMRMDPTDLADVTGYNFLMNGKTSDENWTAIFNKGQKVKLRFINASAMTIYDISIPGLKMKFTQADGQPIKPVIADEFRLGVAETYDVIVQPKQDKAYTIFAESLDRTGYVAGTLAPKIGMKGEIPKIRKRALLTMADMRMEGHMMEMESGWKDRGTPDGSKALEYKDLISRYPQKDLRKAEREIVFRFGGSMNRYIWTINGEKFPKPFSIKYGERIRLKFVNDTMMAHPIHLHGMFMQMENGQSMKFMPNKHTVIVPPASEISMLLTANEAGQWAFHCHLLYHMASGMMTSINVIK